MTTLLWILAVLMIIVGVVGTVLPVIPGVALVFGGIALGAWVDGFTHIKGWTVGFLALMAIAGFATDYVAAALGARRAGASKLAIVGAAIGTLAGIFTGFIGLVFMPLVGAAVGQFLSERDMLRAGTVGIATWIGLLIGTVVKVAIVFTMIGIFAFAMMF
ncbi:MAG TPA: DUF456 family protein [Casimicrobiaceae bacterium]|nr:DUF456 family protein [Casimicrobiaceae bacterium]